MKSPLKSYDDLCIKLKGKIPNIGDYAFKGMIPIVNSMILQSDTFHKTKYKAPVLLLILAASSLLLSYSYSSIISKIFSAMFGSKVADLTNKILLCTFALVHVILFTYKFISYYRQYKPEQAEAVNQPSAVENASEQVAASANQPSAAENEQGEATDNPTTEEQQDESRSYRALKSAISDVSILHVLGTFGIAAISGVFFDHLVGAGRKLFDCQSNDFTIDTVTPIAANAQQKN